ncbi:alpha-tocopherol transfer protein isoform X1 [Crotalus tigris]|uniref:alpha-tocopherol transfer protein isoform X1 n=1 Tax=Crotalus tigris TaxID=88082 RepID=UPI00192F9508|nr:alpha-tocopherol transfer protein isoform X1 [Crotalus tigris]
MDQGKPPSPPVNLNELPEDSPHVRAAIVALRCKAVEENLRVCQSDLSDACLIRFLRCRDFDSNLAWKVKGSRYPTDQREREHLPALPASSPPNSRLTRGFLQVLKNYHRWRRECPEITTNLHPPSYLSLLQTGLFGISKRRDPSGSRVIFYRIARWDPKIFTADDLFRVSIMLSELIVRELDTQRNGTKSIFDLQGWKFAHAFQITPAMIKKIAFILTDGFPLKVREIHLIREPVIFYRVFNLIKHFLPEKIKARIHLHGNNFAHGLKKHIPASLLPEEYNGEAGPFEEFSKELIDILMESTDYLQSISLLA